MNKLNLEVSGPFKLINDNLTALRRALFGPPVKAGETWYTDYREHVPMPVIEFKKPWVYYRWPDGKIRRKLLWEFRLCYCKREDFE